MISRKSLVLAGVALLLVLAAVLAGHRRDLPARGPMARVDVRYLDVQGAVIHEGSSEIGKRTSPADLLLEITLQGAPARARALLFLFDRDGRRLGSTAALELHRGTPRVGMSLRNVGALQVPAFGVLLVGATDRLANLFPGTEAPIELLHTVALAEGSGLARHQIDLRVPGVLPVYDPGVLEDAERELGRGNFVGALARVDALAGTLPEREAARARVIAAEAAFAYGRTALARRIATSALTVGGTPRQIRARLVNVQILATAEGSESTEPPIERAKLRAEPREAPVERALDAALDFRLALLHDRFSREPPRSRAAARELLRLASLVQPPDLLAPVAGILCRGVEKAASADEPYDGVALGAAALLARQSGNTSAIAGCAIAAGDLHRKRSEWPEAEAAFADAANLVAEQDLPREEREALYSAATLAARRGDFSTAFQRAQRAARSVSRLLSLETEMAAREQLLVNTVGYYGVAERFGALAGEPLAAIAVAESGKGGALAALMRGTSRLEAGTLWPEAATPGTAQSPLFADEAARLDGLARALGSADAAISYTLLGMNAERRFEIAIGVVTQDGAAVTLVEQPDTFLTDVIALGSAVEQNREDEAKPLGARLYQTLIAPVADRLAGKDRLFVSPHLRLHALPWNALHDGSRFLVHRFAVSRSLPLLLRDRGASQDAAVFRLDSRARWVAALNPHHAGRESLPGFDVFDAELRRRFASMELLESTEATAERLRAALAKADAFLFAGHATYDASDPLSSALFTAAPRAEPPTSPWARDRLAARSLLRLEKELDLVILLGCETSRLWRGKSSYADEAVGLGRALLVAGARHVVGSLWPMLDRDAEDFLRALLATDAHEDVVRHVQHASRCLAEQRCRSRGIASWGSFVVESR